MNKAYHKDGTPKNLICSVKVNPDTFDTTYYARFIKLPKEKYSNGACRSFVYLEVKPNTKGVLLTQNTVEWRSFTPIIEVSLSYLPKDFQKFVMRYYEDTFGAPGDSEGS